MKTTDLNGNALNYAVALAKQLQATIVRRDDGEYDVFIVSDNPSEQILWTPILGGQGDDIIDEEAIATRRHSDGTWYAILSSDLGDSSGSKWSETTYKNAERYGQLSYEVNPRTQRGSGETRRIAAMRCYVLSVLGKEVAIPKQLRK